MQLDTEIQQDIESKYVASTLTKAWVVFNIALPVLGDISITLTTC
jgi:hypothetical protein